MLDGTIHPDYADVAAAFIRQIPRDGIGGGAVCVYHGGKQVVDVWGGTKDADRNPWLTDTIAPSFSTTKGVMSTLLHVLVEKGLLDYQDPIAKHWPDFGQNDKHGITVRHALCHEAGLYRITDMIASPQEMLDWEHMKDVIAKARPVHAPGEKHGYHALTFGWILGGLIEAVTEQSLQKTLRRELVKPLGLDGAFIGLPDSAIFRRAKLIEGITEPPREKEHWRMNIENIVQKALFKGGIDLRENRAALSPFNETFDWNARETVTATIPAATGQFTARSLARMYAMIAEGGTLDDVQMLSPDRVIHISKIQNRGRDEVLFVPMQWRLGYHRIINVGPSVPDAFGHYGYGGSGAFCDPTRRLAVAMTVNTSVRGPKVDTRMLRIARAAIGCADRARRTPHANTTPVTPQ